MMSSTFLCQCYCSLTQSKALVYRAASLSLSLTVIRQQLNMALTCKHENKPEDMKLISVFISVNVMPLAKRLTLACTPVLALLIQNWVKAVE